MLETTKRWPGAPDPNGLVEQYRAEIAAAIRAEGSRWRLAREDARDLEHELWLCVLRDRARVLRGFQGRSKLRSYLFRVLRRVAGRWVAALRQRASLETQMGNPTLILEGRPHGRPWSSCEQDLLRREGRALIASALARLSPLDRAVYADCLENRSP